MIKKLFFVISTLILLAMAYLIFMNMDNIIDIHYLKGFIYTLDSENPYVSIHTSIGLYTMFALGVGAFVGAGIISLFLGIQGSKIKAYKRELEKTTVNGEASASKVQVLEAKIKTLENAFDSVVDERTQLEVKIQSLNAEIESMKK